MQLQMVVVTMPQRSRLIALATFALVAAGCEADGGGVPVPWLSAEGFGGRVVKIGYENDPCTRARQARVEEDRRAVTVTLLAPERDPERPCVALAKPGCVTVRLAGPLGGKRVVDGAPQPIPHSKRGADRLPFRRFGRCRPVPVAR